MVPTDIRYNGVMSELGPSTDLPHLNYDFRLSTLSGHSLTAHNDSSRC
jgi:hypothetical protein